MGRPKIDLTGQQFGKLTVLYEMPERKNGRIYWHCKCECGNECDIRGENLKSGHTKSCGCLNKELASQRNIKDLIGQKFGKLIVIEDTGERNSNNGVLWLCQCDCGNTCKVVGADLIRGHTKSCGCTKSQGEEKISQILKDNNILFEKQKIFDNCRFEDSNKPARFDFYVNNQYIIEYDGSQHFKARNTGWNTLENLIKTQEHDKIKNQWCKDNNIPIIRIPYWHLDNLCLNDLLLETSQFIIFK